MLKREVKSFTEHTSYSLMLVLGTASYHKIV